MNASSSSPSSACVQFRPEQLGLSAGVPLGSGAISHVVQCHLRCAANPSLPVVVKIVSKLQVLQQGKVQSVMNEKVALQRLGPHPYVARLYGTSQSEDELYYVLEWLPHGDLLQHIRRAHLQRLRDYNAANAKGPSTEGRSSSSTGAVASIPAASTALRCLDFHDIRLIAAQLITALSHAAEKGVVLRDLKPENVAFDEKYRACLLDFDTVDLDGASSPPETNHGVTCPPPPCGPTADVMAAGGNSGNHCQSRAYSASAADAESSAAAALPTGVSPPRPPPPHRRLTVSEIQGMRKKSASFCGTAQYVSPEMVGECKWSFSSDLWAFGALVYEMAYGVHLFAGTSQFEVLQKVIQGYDVGSAGLFPTIDFGEDGRFISLKDFIQQLLSIDPSKRLGVNPQSQRFDAAALRGHALFRDFTWEVVDEQLRTFRARSFSASGSSDTASSQRSPGRSAFDKACERRAPISDEEEAAEEVLDEASATVAAAAVAAAQAALATLLDASVDPSPSLAAYYHAMPFNDPSYADYVYRATADANPFEKFFTDATKKTTTLEGKEEMKTETVAMASAGKAGPAAPSSSSTCNAAAKNAIEAATMQQDGASADAYQRGDSQGEDDDDVIDDVGMQYVGSHAHLDFQE